MTLQRVLFVDDELQVLQGLQNLLRKDRRRWDMAFATSGEEALAELERGPVDLIVSDMRMPGMDGAGLLAEVKRRSPSTIRIILSGHAEREGIFRALPVAHQFLSKPCDAEQLRAAVERACNLRALFANEALRQAVGCVEALPSAPHVYWELSVAMLQRYVSVAQISAIVEQDPAIAAKILQLVNSAYFGVAQEITSIQTAVTYIGLELLKGLAIASSVFSVADRRPPGFSLDRFQRRALVSARVARRLVADGVLAEEAFTAALLHDIGRIIIAIALPARWAGIEQAVRDGIGPASAVEREALGVTHGEVGAYLLGVWGLPLSIVEAVACHHSPASVTSGRREVLAAVHVASVSVERVYAEWHAGGPPEVLDMGFLETVGLIDQLPRWQAIASEELDAARAVERGCAS